jgi:hypothetical protein
MELAPERFTKNLWSARTSDAKLAAHFNKFLSSYAGALGKVAAGLTGGVIVALLYHLGVGKEVIEMIWANVKPKPGGMLE